MKQLLSFLAIATGMTLLACSENTSTPYVDVEWSVENLDVDSGMPQQYRQTFKVSGRMNEMSRLAFNQFSRKMEVVNPEDTIIELVPGYFAVASPRFAAAAEGDTVTIELLTRGAIYMSVYGVDGVHIVLNDGTTAPTNFYPADMTANPRSYSTSTTTKMPNGEDVYARNERIANGQRSFYDVAPSFKSVVLTGETVNVDFGHIIFENLPEELNQKSEEAYVITVNKEGVKIAANKRYHRRLAMRMEALFGVGFQDVPAAVITDYPDMSYRGLMIDIARNNQPVSELYKILDQMAALNLNTFHFHSIDDEAWRLEIPSIPELIEVGSHRGYFDPAQVKNAPYLPQLFAGNGDPNATTGTANGYVSRAEFIELLKYAESLGIDVITEVESPGHGRAAIKAMDLRAERLNDPSLRLVDPDDASNYDSAQAFHDNIMNPAVEGVYTFMSTVLKDVEEMYAEAGVPLRTIHIGGDEVAKGAWDGSPMVQALKEREGLENQHDVHGYFVKRIVEIMKERNIKISGWHEVATDHTEEYCNAVSPYFYSVNCWHPNTSRGNKVPINEQVAKAGFPVLLSNVNHFYLDMSQSWHPYEKGLTWGGIVEVRDVLSGYPSKLLPGRKPIGIQAQVWAETIRSTNDLENLLFPRLFAVAERAWNNDSTYTESDFYAVIASQLPRLAAEGVNFHVDQPGIHISEGTYVVNTIFPNAEIRVTTDGTNPTATTGMVVVPGESQVIPEGATQLRAVQTIEGHTSLVTIQYVQ